MKPTLSPRNLKLLILVAPTVLLALYFVLVSSKRYVSQSVVATQRNGAESSPSLPGAAALLAGISSSASSTQDTRYLTQYILSPALLAKLDQTLKLREHYSVWRLDLPYRLRSGATQEDFLEYYRNRVEVSLDDLSGMLTVRVQAFDAEFAHRLNAMILNESEKWVNETSHAIARTQLAFAEGELKLAFDRMTVARNQLLAFQTHHELVDPLAEAQANVNITAELQATVARREADLKNALTFMHEETPQIAAIRSEIKALNAQIEAERQRSTVNSTRGARLNALATEFQGLKLQNDFATDAYKIALGGVESARVDATRQLKSLIVIEPPSLPESADYPRYAFSLATLAIVSLLVYAIVRLVLAAIREHQE